jgi:hypothetical protein
MICDSKQPRLRKCSIDTVMDSSSPHCAMSSIDLAALLPHERKWTEARRAVKTVIPGDREASRRSARRTSCLIHDRTITVTCCGRQKSAP